MSCRTATPCACRFAAQAGQPGDGGSPRRGWRRPSSARCPAGGWIDAVSRSALSGRPPDAPAPGRIASMSGGAAEDPPPCRGGADPTSSRFGSIRVTEPGGADSTRRRQPLRVQIQETVGEMAAAREAEQAEAVEAESRRRASTSVTHGQQQPVVADVALGQVLVAILVAVARGNIDREQRRQHHGRHAKAGEVGETGSRLPSMVREAAMHRGPAAAPAAGGDFAQPGRGHRGSRKKRGIGAAGPMNRRGAVMALRRPASPRSLSALDLRRPAIRQCRSAPKLAANFSVTISVKIASRNPAC